MEIPSFALLTEHRSAEMQSIGQVSVLSACSANNSVRVTLACRLKKVNIQGADRKRWALKFLEICYHCLESALHAHFSLLSHSGHLPNPEEFHRTWTPSPSLGSFICASGEDANSQDQEEQPLIFLLFICVTSFVFLLAFPGTEKWAHLENCLQVVLLLTGL